MKLHYLKILLIIFLAMIGAKALGYDAEIDGIYYNFFDTTATVTDRSYTGKPYSGAVVIPSSVTYNGNTYSVTSIGNGAFQFSTGLTSITIPNSVTNIDHVAFAYCTGLTSITIPESVTSIGTNILLGCTGINTPVYTSTFFVYLPTVYHLKYTIPNGIKEICGGAFNGCTRLPSVEIPESVTTIGSNAFNGCTGLTTVNIPESVTSVGENAFRGCAALKSPLYNSTLFVRLPTSYQHSYDIPNGIKVICEHAFLDCTSLIAVTIPESVTSILTHAFWNCSNLNTVTINSDSILSRNYSKSYSMKDVFVSRVQQYVLGNQVKSIGNCAFYGCTGLINVTIPNSVTTIGANAFYGCSELAYITIPNSVTSIGAATFGSCTSLTSVTIPNSVTKIEYGTFNGCTNLLSIDIPNSVTNIGGYAFGNCTGLISFTVPNSVTTIGEQAFRNCSRLESVSLPVNLAKIEHYTFYGDSSLVSVTIPNSVTSIEYRAFSGCSALTSITIPNSVKNIEKYAFEFCVGLTSVIIPDDMTNFEDNVFYGCTGLTSPVYSSTLFAYMPPSFQGGYTIPDGIKTICNTAFSACHSLTSISIGNSVTSIGAWAFANCTGLTSISIPKSVDSIGDGAFSGCTGLASPVYTSKFFVYMPTSFQGEYTIPDGIKTICGSAFSNCTGLTNISIPNSVTKIGNRTFEGCTGLNSVIIPNSVTDMGDYVFCMCTDLYSITIGNRVSAIGDFAFYNCNRLSGVIIPNGVTRIGEYAFSGCTSLTTVYNDNSLKSIGQYAFDNCSNLASFDIPKSMTDIGNHAFFYCTALTSATIGKNVTKIGPQAFYGTGLTSVIMEGVLPLSIDSYTFAPAVSVYVAKGSPRLLSLWSAQYENIYDIDTKEKIVPFRQTASSIQFDDYTETDGIIAVSQTIQAGEKAKENTNAVLGLEPDTDYAVNYSIKIQYMNSEGDMNEYDCTAKTNVKTESLIITTQQPKVISPGNVIVAAESNLDDEETNVGFEWRRTDWPDDFASNTGGAYLYESTMEGYIRNLYTEKLWKYRPYYESNSGNRYYGEWVGIDPTNTSYFEPTVHTYAQVQVQGNTAQVKGYAMRGTDNVTSQGFMYWKQTAESRSDVQAAASVPTDAMTVEVRGTVMEAELTGLDYDADYCYVAFVTTSEGETFYGSLRQFSTGPDPAGISTTMAEAEAVPVAYYDLNGHNLTAPRSGLNIVLMSDGTTRKIVVR